ncbi:hypothetical protein Jiend_50970 [Micromonospora endophytica]|nr:hypothetical protein Jiend_50970 [Micromonospora endophytica]
MVRALDADPRGDHARLRRPLALAAFYQRATGLALHPKSDDEFAGLTREDVLWLPLAVHRLGNPQAGRRLGWCRCAAELSRQR